MALIGPQGLSLAGTAAPRTRTTAPTVQTPVVANPTAPAAAPAAVDYNALLRNDPILGQAFAGINTAGVQNQAGLQAAQQRALIQYGIIPGASLPGVSGVDDVTRQLAAQNTQAGTSTQANLQRAYQTAQQTSNASLAARGLLRSGAYGQHAAENLQGYNQAQYQANQTLLDYLHGLYSGYLTQQQALSGQGVQASTDALNRIIAQISSGQLGGGATPPPPTAAAVAPAAASPAAGPWADSYQNALSLAAATRRNVAV